MDQLVRIMDGAWDERAMEMIISASAKTNLISLMRLHKAEVLEVDLLFCTVTLLSSWFTVRELKMSRTQAHRYAIWIRLNTLLCCFASYFPPGDEMHF